MQTECHIKVEYETPQERRMIAGKKARLSSDPTNIVTSSLE